MSEKIQSQRLDANFSAFYAQQLQYIAPQAFDVKVKPLLARQLIPTIQGVPRWAETYKFRGKKYVGKAKLGSDKSNSPRRADVISLESSPQNIVTRDSSFVYSYEEIEAAQAMGIPLSADKMAAAVRAVEELIDLDLSIGDSALGLKGVLRLDNTTTRTAGTKTGGGKAWSAAATAKEIYDDVVGLINKINDETDDDRPRFRVVLPRSKYQLLRDTQMGDGDSRTIFERLMQAESDRIESINPWGRCLLAGGANMDKTRMAAFPSDPGVVGALVPAEPALGQMVQGLMETEQVVKARCGGCVPFFPQYIGYTDEI